MATPKKFETGLDTLFRQYSAQLRRDAGKRSKGKVPKLTRPKLRKRIDRLVCIATDFELKQNGKRKFVDTVKEKRQWHVKRGKGWNRAAKKKTFGEWYDEAVAGRNCIQPVGRFYGGCRPTREAADQLAPFYFVVAF